MRRRPAGRAEEEGKRWGREGEREGDRDSSSTAPVTAEHKFHSNYTGKGGTGEGDAQIT